MSPEEPHGEILLRNGIGQIYLVEVTSEQGMGLNDVDAILGDCQGQHVTVEAEARGMRAPRIVAYNGVLGRDQGGLSSRAFGENSASTLVWISSLLLCGT